ncbi:MAG TPA: hypothetical protein VJZ17_04390 [Nitrosopumilaceae archaeon]|nr:hypothetical protein [Nitrosopumilaceae archaeon]
MQKLVFFLVITFLLFNAISAYAQQPRLATFHETAQVIVDQRFQNKISTSITVMSTSTQEIRVPVELDQKIRDTEHVVAVVITNEDQCVLGVIDEACVLINISREEFEGGINETQSNARKIGDSLIGDINKAFDIDAKFHSVFIHFDDKINRELETSGIISGRGIVSAVYTMPKSDTSFLYETLSAILFPQQIRESGGFLELAKKISNDSISSVTFSIIPKDATSIFQLQVSRDYPIEAKMASISPLEFFGTEKLERSDYFKAGFFPLNSLIQIVVLSNETMKVTDHGSDLIPTIEKDGEKYPSDLTRNGWLFDPDSGDMIVGKYLFGKTFDVNKNDLKLTISDSTQSETTVDNSLYILAGIAVVAAAAIFFYLKNPRTKH